jgi:hypothetical protein
MRRLAVLLSALAAAGCGDGDKDKRTAPVKEAGKRDAAVERDLERVRESDLPDDAKRELEEAAELLEDSE